MKLFISFFLGLVLLFAPGCVTSGTSTTQPSAGSLVNNPLVLKTTASLTTSVTLNNIKPADRQQVARLVYAVATGIKSSAETGNIDINALNELSAKLLTGVPETYRPQVGILVSAIQGLALDRLNQAVQATQAGDTQKAETYRQLVVAVASGVQETSLLYTGGQPSLVIGAASENFGQIKVPALKWQ